MATEFQQEQFEKIYPTGIEKHYWNNSRNIHIKYKLKDLGIKEEPILEIGCGRGVVVNYLRNYFKNCTGVELAKNEIDSPNDYLIYETNACNLPEAFRKKVQVILLLDVIEHIEFPDKFLSQIKEAFPFVKYFLITVPARQEIWSNYDEFNQHFLRYNKKTLLLHTKALKGNVIYLSYLYRLLYFPARILKLLSKNRNIEIKAPKDGIQLFIHKLLSFWFVFESRFKALGFPGTSLIAIFETNKKA